MQTNPAVEQNKNIKVAGSNCCRDATLGKLFTLLLCLTPSTL